MNASFVVNHWHMCSEGCSYKIHRTTSEFGMIERHHTPPPHFFSKVPDSAGSLLLCIQLLASKVRLPSCIMHMIFLHIYLPHSAKFSRPIILVDWPRTAKIIMVNEIFLTAVTPFVHNPQKLFQ